MGLRRRLDLLESENAKSEAKVCELEDKLAAAGEYRVDRTPQQDGELGVPELYSFASLMFNLYLKK